MELAGTGRYGIRRAVVDVGDLYDLSMSRNMTCHFHNQYQQAPCFSEEVWMGSAGNLVVAGLNEVTCTALRFSTLLYSRIW